MSTQACWSLCNEKWVFLASCSNWSQQAVSSGMYDVSINPLSNWLAATRSRENLLHSEFSSNKNLLRGYLQVLQYPLVPEMRFMKFGTKSLLTLRKIEIPLKLALYQMSRQLLAAWNFQILDSSKSFPVFRGALIIGGKDCFLHKSLGKNAFLSLLTQAHAQADVLMCDEKHLISDAPSVASASLVLDNFECLGKKFSFNAEFHVTFFIRVWLLFAQLYRLTSLHPIHWNRLYTAAEELFPIQIDTTVKLYFVYTSSTLSYIQIQCDCLMLDS